jgi:hypothetical protein
MFKDIHFDVDAMLKAPTKERSSQNMESQGTPAGGSNKTGTTSGSRKRGGVGLRNPQLIALPSLMLNLVRLPVHFRLRQRKVSVVFAEVLLAKL